MSDVNIRGSVAKSTLSIDSGQAIGTTTSRALGSPTNSPPMSSRREFQLDELKSLGASLSKVCRGYAYSHISVKVSLNSQTLGDSSNLLLD